MNLYCNVRPLSQERGKLQGFANIHIDNAFWINDCPVLKNDKGELYVKCPSQKVGDKEPKAIGGFSREMQESLNRLVTDAFDSKDHKASSKDDKKIYYDAKVYPNEKSEIFVGSASIQGKTSKEAEKALFFIRSMNVVKTDNGYFISMPQQKQDNKEHPYKDLASFSAENHFHENLVLNEAKKEGIIPEKASKEPEMDR